MTKLGTTITTTKQIMTPGGHPLRPFDEFEREKMRENLDARLDECGYMRQTGRTTRMVIEILEAAVNDPDQHIVVLAHNYANVKHINVLLHHYMDQYGLGEACGARGRVHVCADNMPDLSGFRYRTFEDNVIPDTQSQKKTPGPITKYRKGQHVNILVKNVWIRKIEFAGGDSDAYQYVGQTPNGASFFFTDDDVICVDEENE